MRRSFAQSYVSLYYGLEYHASEMFLEFFQYLVVDRGPSVEHGHDEAFYGKFRIYTLLHQPDCLEQLSKSLKGEELRLDRNDD